MSIERLIVGLTGHAQLCGQRPQAPLLRCRAPLCPALDLLHLALEVVQLDPQCLECGHLLGRGTADLDLGVLDLGERWSLSSCIRASTVWERVRLCHSTATMSACTADSSMSRAQPSIRTGRSSPTPTPYRVIALLPCATLWSAKFSLPSPHFRWCEALELSVDLIQIKGIWIELAPHPFQHRLVLGRAWRGWGLCRVRHLHALLCGWYLIYRKNKAFKDLGYCYAWPKVADAVIEAWCSSSAMELSGWCVLTGPPGPIFFSNNMK